MFYSSPLSNAPLNYTERRQCQTPIAPNLLLHCVKQQPSNLVSLITAHHNCCALSLSFSLYEIPIMLLVLNFIATMWIKLIATITKFKLKSHFRRTSHFCYLWIIFSTLLLYLTRNVELFKAHQKKCIWEPETVLMKRCNVKVFNTERH